MGESLGSILWRIARTAVLVAACAAVFLLALNLMALLPGAHLILALLLAAPLAALCFWQALEALRSGELPQRFGVDRRARQPVAYWAGVSVLGLGAVLLAALAIWAALDLLLGAPPAVA